MTTNPTDILPAIDPEWRLHAVPRRGQPVTGRCFAVLLHAARTMKTVGDMADLEPVFAAGLTYTEGERERPARRSTFRQFLKDRPDLAAILEDAINIRRAETVAKLESQALRIALGDGDVTRDFRADGSLARERRDMRNASYMTLQLLKGLKPDTFGDRKRVTVDGGLEVQHTARLTGDEGIRITPDEIQRLSAEKAGALLDLLSEIMEMRNADRELERANREGAPRMLPAQRCNSSGDGQTEGGPPTV
jgi:hypothetical protein